MDEELFKDYSFMDKKPQERYPESILMFCENITYRDNIISYEVKKHPIIISL